MPESIQDRLLYRMVFALGEAAAFVQQSLLLMADTPAFDNSVKLALLKNNDEYIGKIKELMALAGEYKGHM